MSNWLEKPDVLAFVGLAAVVIIVVALALGAFTKQPDDQTIDKDSG